MCSGGNGGRNDLFIRRGWWTFVEEKAAMVQWIYGACCFVRRNPSPSASSITRVGPLLHRHFLQPASNPTHNSHSGLGE